METSTLDLEGTHDQASSYIIPPGEGGGALQYYPSYFWNQQRPGPRNCHSVPHPYIINTGQPLESAYPIYTNTFGQQKISGAGFNTTLGYSSSHFPGLHVLPYQNIMGPYPIPVNYGNHFCIPLPGESNLNAQEQGFIGADHISAQTDGFHQNNFGPNSGNHLPIQQAYPIYTNFFGQQNIPGVGFNTTPGYSLSHLPGHHGFPGQNIMEPHPIPVNCGNHFCAPLQDESNFNAHEEGFCGTDHVSAQADGFHQNNFGQSTGNFGDSGNQIPIHQDESCSATNNESVLSGGDESDPRAQAGNITDNLPAQNDGHEPQNQVTGQESKRNQKKFPYCTLCKANGELAYFYMRHTLKDESGKPLCPVLRALRCPICGATGDNSHTKKYCPENMDTTNSASGFQYRMICNSTGSKKVVRYH